MLTELQWQVPEVFAVAGIATFLAAVPARAIGYRGRIMDHPGSRSSHNVAVPRTGGMAIVLGMAVTMLIFGRFTFPLLLGLASVALIAIISFLDDLVTISSVLRLVVHLVVTGVTVNLIGLELTEIHLPGYCLHLPRWGGLCVSVLFVAGFVNFFNFMDGINGIAVAQGLFGGATLAGLLLWGGGSNSVVVAAALAGACLGFGPHNFPKAKMFMGDSGSTILGYILAILTLAGAKNTSIPWLAFVFPLGVFIYDAVFTLVKRITRRENFLKPHREHHYQLLIRCGWSHTKVTGLQAVLMLLCSIGGVLYGCGNGAMQWAVIGVLSVIAAVYSVFVHRYFASHRQDVSGSEAVLSNTTLRS